MGSFEEHYPNDALASFTGEQRRQLRSLHENLDAKYEEIALLIANDIGLPERSREAYNAADQAIERWEEDAEISDHPVAPTTPLQRLLQEHHQISDQITVVWDDALER
jgi:acyl-CoA reductase-like NAD-dependent aldehyde dehydrogenase